MENITKSMARVSERQDERFAWMQRMINFRTVANGMLSCFGHEFLEDHYQLTPIKNVFICPEEITMPYNKDYILVAFDFEPSRTGMEIVKTSEKYTTTHFREYISKN